MGPLNGAVAVDEQTMGSSTSSHRQFEVAQTNIPTQAPHAPRMPYLQAPPVPQQVNRPAQVHREVPERPPPNLALAGRQNLFNERNENNAQFLDNPIDDEDEDEGDVGDDLDGVLEAVGMRGSLWLLAQNSILMCLLISLCLGAAVWVPYLVGEMFILVSVGNRHSHTEVLTNVYILDQTFTVDSTSHFRTTHRH